MAFLGLVGLALAMPQAPDFSAEFKALDKEFDKAMEAYYAPYSTAKTDEERAQIVLDPEKHPAKEFTARYQDLATRAKGTETGARAHFWIAANLSNLPEPDAAAISKALDSLIADYLESPVLAELAEWLPYGARAIGDKKAREVLAVLSEKPKSGEIRAAGLYALAMVEQEAGANEKALAIFRRLQKDHAGTEQASQAEGALYELEHLQIGMVAPDFDAIDEKGVAWKLSEYKGKVVVLDFWGIW